MGNDQEDTVVRDYDLNDNTTIIIAGNSTVDLVTNAEEVIPDGKRSATGLDFKLGGGAMNAALGLKALNQLCLTTPKSLQHIFNNQTHNVLFTSIGEQTEDLVTEVYHLVLKRRMPIDDPNFTYIDAIEGEKIRRTINPVIQNPEGRYIPREIMPSATKLADNLRKKMNLYTSDAKISFADPRKPFVARMAGRTANQNGVLFSTDWGNDAWSKDPKVADAHTEIITTANILILPDDAVVEHMEDKIRRPKELMDRAQNQYKNAAGEKPLILMSNGQKNVQVFDGDKTREIEVPNLPGPKYVNGIGDFRNSVLLHLLAAGKYDFFESAQIATIMASIYAQHPERTCVNHIHEYTNLFRDFNGNAAEPRIPQPQALRSIPQSTDKAPSME